MEKIDLKESFCSDEKIKFLENIQEIFSLSRQISNQDLSFNIPVVDNIPAFTASELSRLARLMQTTYVLISVMNEVSNTEKAFFKESIERAKESVLALDNPILQAYYVSDFNRLKNLLDIMILPDVSLMEL